MSYPRFKFRALGAAACIAATAVVAACSSGGAGGSNASGVVTVAVVSNPLITSQMEPLTRSVFQKQHPGITVKFATYTEGDLRAAIEKDVSTHSNSFNVIMIGPYETPLFAKNGWLTNLASSSRRTRATTPPTCCRRSRRRCPTRAACTRCRSTASRRWSSTARTCLPRPG
jgi:sorbitol/mannitol transport system substrate-binding protein